MTQQNEWEVEFEELLVSVSDRLRAKAKFLAESGGIDKDEYPTANLLARVLLVASVEAIATKVPFIMHRATSGVLADLENLRHF